MSGDDCDGAALSQFPSPLTAYQSPLTIHLLLPPLQDLPNHLLGHWLDYTFFSDDRVGELA